MDTETRVKNSMEYYYDKPKQSFLCIIKIFYPFLIISKKLKKLEKELSNGGL